MLQVCFQIGMFYQRYFVMSQKAMCVDCKFIVFFNKFPSSDFRVHWNARNSELGKTNSEIPTSEQSGTRH